MNCYKTISSANNAELIIKKSKFIGLCTPVKTKDEADNFLEELKKEYSNANHICYAYVMTTGDEKAFDDGEPSGTAGLPILNIIKKKGLTNVLIAVVRYFGGVKLGAGGLMRAYSKLASQCLSGVQITEYKEYLEYQITLAYDEVSNLDKISNQNLFEITKKQYLEEVLVNLIVLEEDKEKLQNFLNNLFNKNIELVYLKTVLREKK